MQLLTAVRLGGDDLVNYAHLPGDIHDLDDLPMRGAFVTLDNDHRRVVQQLPLFLQLVLQVGR